MILPNLKSVTKLIQIHQLCSNTCFIITSDCSILMIKEIDYLALYKVYNLKIQLAWASRKLKLLHQAMF